MFVQMLKESREEKMSSGDRFSKKKNVFFDIFFASRFLGMTSNIGIQLIFVSVLIQLAKL